MPLELRHERWFNGTSMFSLRQILGAAVVALTLIGMGPKSHASTIARCESLFFSLQNLETKVDLGSQLEAIERRLHADDVRISDLQLSIRRGERARVDITLGDVEIAYGYLRPSDQGVHVGRVWIENIRVHFKYSRRGLGTLTYLLLAREAVRRGLVLQSSWDPSNEASAVWSQLVKFGWAKKIDHLFNEFHPDFIRNPETLETLDRFTERFKQR